MSRIVSVKAELSVLRGMTCKDKKVAGTLISNCDADYFYSPESVELYSALLRNMSEQGQSPSYKLLLEDPEISEEARSHFRDSTADIQTIEDANKATRILNKYRQKRGLFNLAAYIGEQLKSTKQDVDGTLQKVSTTINAIRSKKSTDESFLHFGRNNSSTGLVNSILDDDNSEEIIPTGIEAFDEISAGFSRGGLVSISSTSGGGKSTLASQLAVNMATMGYKVLLVPLEMSKREMTARIMACVTKTDLSKILQQKLATGEKELVRKRMVRWMKKVKDAGGRYTIFKPQEDMNIEEVFAATSTYDSDVRIIDYVSLLKGVDGDDQVRALGQVARYAKINAENTNTVNVLLCQLNDEGKIKYSRAISEHSSNSWTWVATKELKETGVMKIEQPKSRNSLSFPFLVKIDYATMQVTSVQQEESLGAVDKNKPLPNLAVDV